MMLQQSQRQRDRLAADIRHFAAAFHSADVMARRFSSLSDMRGQNPMLVPESTRLHSGRNSVCGGSLHSGRSSLCASSARSSISISCRSGSLASARSASARSRRSSSSVSMRLPHSENFLLPEIRGESRISMNSAWQTIRGSVLSLGRVGKVLLFAPCSRHKCCLGCVSLRDAVPLICVAEIVVIALFTLIAVDLYVTDGKLFYTNELEGHGKQVAIGFIVFILISLPIIGLTLSAWRYHRRQLYLVHIIWQWTVLELIFYFAYHIFSRVFSEEERERTKFLLPSAIVLSAVSIIAIIVQSWWIFVFIDALFYEQGVVERRHSANSLVSKRTSGYRGNFEYGIDNDSVGTIDSRRHSFAIPIVKLRKASEDVERLRSLDTESLPGLRLASVMEGIPELNADEIADV